MRNIFISIIVGFVIISGSVGVCKMLYADEKEYARASVNQAAPALTEEQRKVMDFLGEAKKKVDALVQEREALLQKGASQEQVQAKSAQIMQTQKDAMESLKKMFPKGLPPLPGMNMPQQGPPQLSAEEQVQLNSLIEKRRQMVMNGAKFEEVESLTNQIQEKYYGKKMTPPPPSLPTPPNQNLPKPSVESSKSQST